MLRNATIRMVTGSDLNFKGRQIQYYHLQ